MEENIPLTGPEPGQIRAMGWLPDYPDFRDYSPENENVAPMLANVRGVDLRPPDVPNIEYKITGNGGAHPQRHGGTATAVAPTKVAVAAPTAPAIPPVVDLRPWFSPVEDQLNLGSCTANAAVGVVEYFERRAFNKYIDASRLFVYKVTRDLMHVTGDTGAYLRTTMKTLACFGAPPEEYWPYVIPTFDMEPSAFAYSFAQDYKALTYFRLDTPAVTRPVLLALIKNYLYAGIPSMFGFTVYSSYRSADTTGKIPYPVPGEGRVGGHAIVAAGFDDNMKIVNPAPGATPTTGAFLIRNSWSTRWGDHGYGWLPYEYVLQGQAVDWWCLIKAAWIDTGNFGA